MGGREEGGNCEGGGAVWLVLLGGMVVGLWSELHAGSAPCGVCPTVGGACLTREE